MPRRNVNIRHKVWNERQTPSERTKLRRKRRAKRAADEAILAPLIESAVLKAAVARSLYALAARKNMEREEMQRKRPLRQGRLKKPSR